MDELGIGRWQESFIEKAFTYQPPKEDQPIRYSAIRAKAKELAQLIANLTPESVEQAQAFLHLQQTVMWANASIAINE